LCISTGKSAEECAVPRRKTKKVPLHYKMLPQGDWDRMRAMYEAGEPPSVIIRTFGICYGTLATRRKREGWSRPEKQLVAPDATDADAADEMNDQGREEEEGGRGPEKTRAVAPAAPPAAPPTLPLSAEERERREATSAQLRLARGLRQRIDRILTQEDCGAGPKGAESRAVLDATSALEKLQKVERVALGMEAERGGDRASVVIVVPQKLSGADWARKARREQEARQADFEVVPSDLLP
jgi:hypothetical protein